MPPCPAPDRPCFGLIRKTNPFQGTIPVQRLFSMGRTIIMNQIETFLIRWRNAGTLSAYMIRERSGRYWIVPTCGRTPHPRCRLRHGDIGKLPAAVRTPPNRSYRYSGPNDRESTHEISGSSAHRVPPRGRYELRGERIRLYYPI